MKPNRRIATRNHVLFIAKGGNVKTMKHIFRGHDHFHVGIDWDVELAGGRPAALVEERPTPFLGLDGNFQSVFRHRAKLLEDNPSPDKANHEQNEGNKAPEKFENV